MLENAFVFILLKRKQGIISHLILDKFNWNLMKHWINGFQQKTWCPLKIMSSIASSSNIISIITELNHSYIQWIITFCKWILAESPHSILSNVLFLPFSFAVFLKRAHIFLCLSCPSLPAMLNYTFKTLRCWFQKLRLVPLKSNLSQALRLNWIIAQIALSLFSYWLLFPPTPDCLALSLPKTVSCFPWLLESLILTPYY